MEKVQDMRASEQLKGFIKDYEGLRPKSYTDDAGIWTIGYGHTGKNIVKGMEITQSQANDFFSDDLQKFENAVNKYVKVPLSQNQFDALVSFSYNVGIGNFQNSTMLRLLNNGNYEGASLQFAVWNKVTNPNTGIKEANDGLSVRRYDEAQIFTNGNYDRTDINFYRQNIKHTQIQTSQITPENTNTNSVSTSQNTLPQTSNQIKHNWEGFEGLQLINNKYEYLVATSLLKNELGGVSNGYELSHAQTGKSGWSFGGHQMDLSINKEGMNLLKDIVTHHYGSSYWSPELEASLKVANNPNSISESTKEEINKALSSEYGRTKINENFVGSISQIVNHIDEVEKKLKEINPDIKLSNGEKLMLADYHNQYNLSLNSQSNGSMLNKLENCVSKNGDISIEDIKSFFEETKYYIENRTSQSRRVNSTYQSAQELDKGEEASKEQQKSTTHTLEKPNTNTTSTDYIDEIYTVQKGDTLSKIAQNNDTTIDKLIENNPWLEEKNRISEDRNFVLIKAGEQLNIINNKQEDLEIKSLQRFISENGINFENIKSFLNDMRQQNKENIIEDIQSSTKEMKSPVEHRR